MGQGVNRKVGGRGVGGRGGWGRVLTGKQWGLV